MVYRNLFFSQGCQKNHKSLLVYYKCGGGSAETTASPPRSKTLPFYSFRMAVHATSDADGPAFGLIGVADSDEAQHNPGHICPPLLMLALSVIEMGGLGVAQHGQGGL